MFHAELPNIIEKTAKKICALCVELKYNISIEVNRI